MIEFHICKVVHLPTGRYYLTTPTNLDSTRNAWRTKLRNGSAALPHTVRALLGGVPAQPEDWSFEVLGKVSYQTAGEARDAFDAMLRQHVEAAGWENILNVDVFTTNERGERVRTPESAVRRREANGTSGWDKF